MLNKQHGIGLLELMLSLAIIAMLMVAATRYYKTTQTARRVQVAVESTQAIYSARERWLQDGHSYESGDLLSNFIGYGYLSSDFRDKANPWGGSMTAGLGSCQSGQECFVIEFINSTRMLADCLNLKTKLDYNLPDIQTTRCSSKSVFIEMNK